MAFNQSDFEKLFVQTFPTQDELMSLKFKIRTLIELNRKHSLKIMAT